jgi:hypothetical protein
MARNTSKNNTTLAALCHLSALLGTVLCPLNLIIPIVIICCNDNKFVRSQAKECLNFQISVVIWALISAVACFLVVGVFMLVVLAVAAFMLPIFAAISAASGTDYRYPLIFRLIK